MPAVRRKFKFGAVSRANLKGVHRALIALCNQVIVFRDCTVTDGVRTLKEQLKYVLSGASKTMNSKHLTGRAVDLIPYPTDWRLVEKGLQAVKKVDPTLQILKHMEFIGFVNGVAAMQDINVRQGMDWDGDQDIGEHSFLDMPHWEIEEP